ncbi:GNAT family N-acetyltransferase [Paeniglutamicibacter antarcticus]|uniref:GNAT family N-acetyltransferase n=2 Tax=Arthrobacter terrae TaxID=2935737 RepID=A0A931CTM1_9MICC|nr:GNAT family N-acetyltransferase [Arthrobacter terrae]
MSASAIRTRRLDLEPLTPGHAREMTTVLSGPSLYRFTGGEPPTEAALSLRYTAQSAGHSPKRDQAWLNWIVRHQETGAALGFVQATVSVQSGELVADVAWVIAVVQQGNGYAVEAAAGMLCWLGECGTARCQAHIHPGNVASCSVARKLDFAPTSLVHDGEVLWQRTARQSSAIIKR